MSPGHAWTGIPATCDRQGLRGTSPFPNNTHSQRWLETNKAPGTDTLEAHLWSPNGITAGQRTGVCLHGSLFLPVPVQATHLALGFESHDPNGVSLS